MNRRYSVSLHDLRVSAGAQAVESLRQVLERWGAPLAVHLVCDAPLEAGSALFGCLVEGVRRGSLEVVFHGLTHRSPPGAGRWLAVYHKRQAEYLEDSAALRTQTARAFASLSTALGCRLGICPPCWLATRSNRRLFDGLSPLYRESMLWLSTPTARRFSTVVSLGSRRASELVVLRGIARLAGRLSMRLKSGQIRLVIHACDLAEPRSLAFLGEILRALEARGFRRVLLREMAPAG